MKNIIKVKRINQIITFLGSLKIKSKRFSEIIRTKNTSVIKHFNQALTHSSEDKIKNYKKGFYIHYKFEGSQNTLEEIKKKLKVDSDIIRSLTVKYKKLDTKNEFFNKK